MTPGQPRQPPLAEWTLGAFADIGLATVVTDAGGRVLTVNPAAEALTGWSQADAAGRPLADIFRIENEATRQPMTDPVTEVLAAGTAVSLSDHTVLIARGGRECRIDHGAAPVRDPAGPVVGAVLVFCDVSERQRLVQGVEDARAFAEGIVQTVREPLVVLDGGLTVRTANRAFYQTFGTTPAETEGLSLFALAGRQWDKPRLRELLEQILPRDSHFDGFVVDDEFAGLGRRSMVLNARRLPPVGRRPALILLAVEDLTERRRADEQYRDLFNSIDEGFCLIEVLLDPGGRPADFRYLEVNPAFEKQCGLRDVTGKRVRELLPDIEPQSIDLYGRVAATGEPVRASVHVKSLTDNWFDIYAFRRGGEGSRTVAVLFTNTTERQRSAAAVALSEVRYRRLFETAQDGILLVDPGTRRIFDANPFLCHLLGYAHDDLVGKELWQIGLFRDIESNKAAFRVLQEKGYIRYDDLPLRTHDDRGIEVEFVSNVYDVVGTPVIQCNIRDVTDRKRAEDAIRVAHDQLEVRVRDRTAELAHSNGTLQKEIVRREKAEADRRDLQQRLTTVQEAERQRIARELHDQLGQHLTALGLGLKVVKDALADPSPERDRLQGLQSLTDAMGREIHNLALELRPTALDDLGLDAALANYTEGWSERSGVEVDFHTSRRDGDRLPPPIETALYRVVQEALTNVLKHAAANKVSVVLRRSPELVSVVVEDDGRGFDVDATTGQRLGVLGMRERAALVGGTLVVESTPGRGTTVIARIPLTGDGGDA